MSHKRKFSCTSVSHTAARKDPNAEAQKLGFRDNLQGSAAVPVPGLLSSDSSITIQLRNTPPTPPRSTSSPPITLQLPLTKKNLRKLNESNMPSTPGKSKADKTTTGTHTTQSVSSMKKVLEKNHLYINDLAAEERGKSVIEEATEIVKGDRHSTIKEDTARELRRMAIQYADDNELTFLVNVWKKFLDVDEHSRTVGMTTSGELEDPEAAIQWIETAWKKDYMKCNWSADFMRGSVPKLIIEDHALKQIVTSAPRVKNPKPDLTYGLDNTAFSTIEQEINDQKGACLSQNLYHPFFVVEAKSSAEPIAKAEQQCARAGAAMVGLKRKFDESAQSEHMGDGGQPLDEENEEESDIEQPITTISRPKPIPVDHYHTDRDSFAFSLAIVPTAASLHINWAEEAYSKEGKLITINWHQHSVAVYSLGRIQDWAELHHDLDNVLDWGVLKRKSQIQAICNEIHNSAEDRDRFGSNKRRKIGA